MGLYGGLGEKGVHMSSKTRNLIATASLLAFCGLASAYTITGSVSDSQGNARVEFYNNSYSTRYTISGAGITASGIPYILNQNW